MIDLCVSVYDRYINGGSQLSYHLHENVTPMVPCSLTLVLTLEFSECQVWAQDYG